MTTLIDLLDVQRQRLSAADNAVQAQVQLVVNFREPQKLMSRSLISP